MNAYQKCALFALGAALFAACSSSSNSYAPPLTARNKLIAYTAIGASDAVGYGASVPCTAASPALVADPTCPEPGANGYVPDIRTDLAQQHYFAQLQDLGISGAVVGPAIQQAGDMYASAGGATPCVPRTAANGGVIPGNFLQNELPSVTASTTLITIFAGGNDVNAIVNAIACGAGGGTQASITAYITQEVTAFGEEFGELVAGAHAQAPGAIIVVANIPNFANVPYAFALSSDPTEEGELRTFLQGVSVAIDTDVINTVASKGIPVVDLQCDPESYDTANFYTDGFHPNNTGYALLASMFVSQALSPTPVQPQASCAEQGLAAAPGAAAASSAVRGNGIAANVSIGTTGRFPRL